MTALPLRQLGDRATLHLLGEHDAPWIAEILDEVESSVGQTSRELVDRLARLEVRASSARRNAVIRGLRGWLGRHNGRGGIASRVRQHVLGAPALLTGEREARIAR